MAGEHAASVTGTNLALEEGVWDKGTLHFWRVVGGQCEYELIHRFLVILESFGSSLLATANYQTKCRDVSKVRGGLSYRTLETTRRKAGVHPEALGMPMCKADSAASIHVPTVNIN